MAIKRILASSAVLVVLAGGGIRLQAQGGQQQSGVHGFLFETLNGLVRQYRGGQEAQARSGMRDLLGSVARGNVPRQPLSGRQGEMNRLFAEVVNDVAGRYGGRGSDFGQDMNTLFGDVMGDAFSQFDPASEHYRNLTELFQGWYEPQPTPQSWPQRTSQSWPQPNSQPPPRRNPQQQFVASCVIVGERVLLANSGTVVSPDRGGPVGRLIQPTNPRCRYMVRDLGGGEYCVATSGYVWSPLHQQPVGQCR